LTIGRDGARLGTSSANPKLLSTTSRKSRSRSPEALAASLEERLTTTVPSSDVLRQPPSEFLAAVRGIERRGLVRVLVAQVALQQGDIDNES